MAEKAQVFGTAGKEAPADSPPGNPCVYVIFGAGGDVTRRLMMPAVYNLACDNLLPEQFAIIAADFGDLTTEQYRDRLTNGYLDPNGKKVGGIKDFHTRKQFDQAMWDKLVGRIHYVKTADIDGYKKLLAEVKKLQAEYRTGDNVLFYFAVPPRAFGPISKNLVTAGFQETSGDGWRRIIIEKPFGTNLETARSLNKEILGYWREDQIYRVDHYLGKETVQNLLAFRFSNGIYEPLWNRNHIDHIQFNVSEAVDVEGRGDYYETTGVLRDMMQNHMFPMLAYLTMEPPSSFEPDAVRNEKAKLLNSVRIYTPEEVAKNVVRGQYGPGEKTVPKKDGKPGETETVKLPGYREEVGVNKESKTETFVAAKYLIDNWRWEGVPIYLRSGKALWKRGTEIVVQFRKAPLAIFDGTPVDHLSANRIIFHIQPFQAIETLFQAKIPGPLLRLQTVHSKFSYSDTFKASRYTGYEVMVYAAMNGDATLFSRTDLVEAAWKIAQPLLDSWAATPAPFPNYTRGTWGPIAADELIRRDGRRWFEVLTSEVLEQSPLFKGGDPILLNSLILAVRPGAYSAGETIVKKGDVAHDMYFLCRGQCEVFDESGKILATLKEGDIFGEIGLLLNKPRTASVRAKTMCDVFILDKGDFSRILHDSPQFEERVKQVAKERYQATPEKV